MNFVYPSGLWLLLLGIPIAAFHFYRGRVQKRSVPSLSLWEEVLEEENRRSAFRQLRHRLSLLLNLFILLILTASVAEPIIPGWNSPEKVWAFVLDTSPRMWVEESDGETRLEKSRKAVGEWLEVVGEAALYDGTGLLVPATKDLDQVREALDRVEVKREGDPFQVVRFLKENHPERAVLLFSDRGGAGSVSLRSPRENRGWSRGFWQILPGSSFPTLFLEARRFGGRPSEEELTLSWNGTPFAEEKFLLKTSGSLQVALDPKAYPGVPFDLGGVLEVRWKEADAFSLDDQATFVFPATAPLPVVLFYPDQPDSRLQKALEVLAGAGLISSPVLVPVRNFEEAKSALREGVLCIFDRCAPPYSLSRGSFLFFGAAEGWLPVEAGSQKDSPRIRDWDSEGVLLRGIDLTDFAVRRARVWKGGRMLIASSEGPIAVEESRGGFSSVLFGFPLSLSESDFTLRAAFPLFLRQWVQWIRLGGANRSFPSQLDWFDPLMPVSPLWLENGSVQVRERRGVQEIQVKEGTFPEFCFATAPGPVEIRSSQRQEWIGVNFFHPELSDFRDREKASPPRPDRPWYRDFPVPLFGAGLALFFLLLEWLLYHRGWI